MDDISIGEAARLLRLNTSALRYYDERGLVRPAGRRGGGRRYGRGELRRLAFLKLANGLGIPLETAAAVFEQPGARWRSTVREQIEQLDRLREQVAAARSLLAHTLACEHDTPVDDCPDMSGALDRIIAGVSLEQLASEHRDGPESSLSGPPEGTCGPKGAKTHDAFGKIQEDLEEAAIQHLGSLPRGAR